LHAVGGTGAHVFVYPATKTRPFMTAVTIGLSGFEMPAPLDVPGRSDHVRAELFTYLPADWPMPTRSDDAERGWPFAMLRALVGYAVSTPEWLAPLDTMPNLIGASYGTPFVARSALDHTILIPPVHEEKSFDELYIQGKRVRFLHAVPITKAECDTKVARGFSNSLEQQFDEGRIPVLIDPYRRSAI
jgi:hypothetical protein